jgi:HNH endonuclease
VAQNDSCNNTKKNVGGFTTEMMNETRGKDVAMNDWHIMRQQVLERDNYTCQGCGISEKECHRSLDVHHKIPYNKGGLDVLDNLVTLCPKCHPTEESKSRTLYDDITVVVKRKSRIREGFVERKFHIPKDIDDELRMEAIKTHVRFSDMAILAFREHISRVKGRRGH